MRSGYEGYIELDRTRIAGVTELKIMDTMTWLFNPVTDHLVSINNITDKSNTTFDLSAYFNERKKIIYVGYSDNSYMFAFPGSGRFSWQSIEIECFRVKMEYCGIVDYKFDNLTNMVRDFVFLALLTDTENALFSFFFSDLIVNEKEYSQLKT